MHRISTTSVADVHPCHRAEGQREGRCGGHLDRPVDERAESGPLTTVLRT